MTTKNNTEKPDTGAASGPEERIVSFSEMRKNFRLMKRYPTPPCPSGYRVLPLGFIKESINHEISWNSIGHICGIWFYQNESSMLHKSKINVKPEIAGKYFVIAYIKAND